MDKRTRLTVCAVPQAYECNPHVHAGYRPLGQTWGWYAASALSWHNETINSATMFVGLVLFLDSLEHADSFEKVIFCSAVSLMFACSTAYHIFWPHSVETWRLLMRLDHTCIVLCVGSYVFPLASLLFGRVAIETYAYWFLASVATCTSALLVATGNLCIADRLKLTIATTWFIPALWAHAYLAGRDVGAFVDVSTPHRRAAASAAAATVRSTKK